MIGSLIMCLLVIRSIRCGSQAPRCSAQPVDNYRTQARFGKPSNVSRQETRQ